MMHTFTINGYKNKKGVGGSNLDFSHSLSLPSQFEGIRTRLEASTLRAINIIPKIQRTQLTDSKFSGYPYLPKIMNYPKDIDGNYLIFLAQINFEQVQSFYPFPSSGILQFFISPSLLTYQMSEGIFQHYFKVRYFPKILPEEELITDFPFLKSFSYSPIKNQMALRFLNKIEPVSAMDYRLKQYISHLDLTKQLPDGRTLEEHYFEHFLGAEHKIGGYPYFIHHDMRSNSKLLKRYDTLLLQIVSDDEQNIMWGDSGIIKFFINSKKLAQGDFSDIYLQAEQY
ncbi:DUF1963 domain-containing protein [Ureibacillus terrenus]|uniref:DUF1963 domain-containing protein n=1 Tax=Ureibacillus terrenus TaxID=118246 RepID=A0A540V117_9BACL|nr:DUF1963 domain-containing protein [Ureibacillus terrenus]